MNSLWAVKDSVTRHFLFLNTSDISVQDFPLKAVTSSMFGSERRSLLRCPRVMWVYHADKSNVTHPTDHNRASLVLGGCLQNSVMTWWCGVTLQPQLIISSSWSAPTLWSFIPSVCCASPCLSADTHSSVFSAGRSVLMHSNWHPAT